MGTFMQPPSGATAHIHPVDDQTPAPYFGAGDAVFVIIAILVTLLVAKLGYETLHEGLNTEATKSRGEAMVAWFNSHAAVHAGEANGEALPGCDGAGATWASCRDALVANGGPFAGIKNIIKADNKVFAASCDRTDDGTSGAIMLDKGSPKPPDGASLMYAPLTDDEVFDKGPYNLRISICGRGYAVIHIGEFKF
jgi:hypothetical protein